MHGVNSKGDTQTATAELARPVNIPPRPALLIALQHEISREEPSPKKIVHLIDRDVAIAGNFLAMANSSMYRRDQHIEKIEDAVTLIGLNHCSALITRLMVRRVLAHGRMMLPRFWDVSEKRSYGMMHVAKLTAIISPELAYNFGLFSDIGIPLMMASFPDYAETLALANQLENTTSFVQLENARHRINHAVVGAMLADHWHIDSQVVLAIKKHHAPQILCDSNYATTVRTLIAIFYVVDYAIQQYRQAISAEWLEGGAAAAEILGLEAADIDEICTELKQKFSCPMLS